MKFASVMIMVCGLVLGGSGLGYAKETGKEVELEVLVTATKVEMPIKQVGSSSTVIGAGELALRQSRSLVDAVREVPGLDIRRSGGPGSQASIFMRGTDSDHTLLMVDGIQIHDVASPAGAAAIDHLLIDNVDRVEVVRGPLSPLYGSDAIGGLINIITKKGEGPPTVSLLTEGGSFSTMAQRLSVSGGQPLYHYSITLSRLGTKGISTSAADGEDDPYRNRSVSGRLGLTPLKALDTDFYIRYVDADIEFDAGADPSISETNLDQLIFKVEPRLLLFRGVWEQKLGFWMHRIERGNGGSGFNLPSEFRGIMLGLDWQHNLSLHPNHTLTLGTEFERQDSRNMVVGFPVIEADTKNTAVYIQDLFHFGERLSGTAGFRVDSHEDFGTEVTYRLSGAYNLVPAGTVFRGSVGTGFKAPSLSELFDTSFSSNNPNLNPEQSIGFDVGLEQSLAGGRIEAGGAYFYNDIDDLIVAVFDGTNFQNINIERVVTDGFELFLKTQPVEYVWMRVNYTYTDTEAKEAASFGISKGSRLLRRPLHKLGASAGCRFLGDRAQATVSVLYVGEREDIDPTSFATVTADDYVVANLAASIIPVQHLEIFGRIENVFDERYQEVLGFNAPRIGAFGGVKVTF